MKKHEALKPLVDEFEKFFDSRVDRLVEAVRNEKCEDCQHDFKPQEQKPESKHVAGEKFVDSKGNPTQWEYSGECRCLVKEGEGYIFNDDLYTRHNEDYVFEDPQEILQPLGTHARSLATTTVTVWETEDRLVYQYVFTGSPDIDRVIRETLGQGAYAVKIECSERFCVDSVSDVGNGVYIARINICNGWGIKGMGDCYCNWGTHISDTDIEAAITAYLSKNDLNTLQEKYDTTISKTVAEQLKEKVMCNDSYEIFCEAIDNFVKEE